MKTSLPVSSVRVFSGPGIIMMGVDCWHDHIELEDMEYYDQFLFWYWDRHL